MIDDTAVGPDFICIGGQKAGTRWLFDQVSHHPDFWMPPIKELHYVRKSIRATQAKALHRKAISNIARLNKERENSHMRPLDRADTEWLEALIWLDQQPYNIDLYAKLFNPKQGKLSGDITPSYSLINDDRQVGSLLKRFPRTSIIFIARDPIERLWSQYCMVAGQKSWSEPQDISVVENFIRSKGAIRHSSLMDIIRRWRQPSNIFGLFFFDDLRQDATLFRQKILTFLGADPAKPSGKLQPGFNRKSRHEKIIMRSDVRERLIALLGDEVKASAAQLGGPAAEWPAKYGL